MDGAGNELLGVESEVTDDITRQSLGILGVVDRERTGEAQTSGVAPKDAHACRVEGRHPHLAADLAGQGGDRALIAQVEWQHGHLRDRGQLGQARQLLPRFGMAHPHDVRTRLDQGPHQGLTHRGFAVGDQGLAELGVAAHFAQHFVVGHVLALFLWKTYQHRLARTVQTRTHPNPARGLGDLAVQVHHHRWPRIQRHHAQAPGQALAEKQIIAVVQGGAGQQLAPARLRAPLQAR